MRKSELVYEDSADTFCGSLKYTFLVMLSKRMRWLLPQIFWTGVSLAYWSGLAAIIIARTIPDESAHNQLIASLYGLSVLGVGEMVGSVVMSQIVDRASSRVGVLVNVVSMPCVWLISYIMLS